MNLKNYFTDLYLFQSPTLGESRIYRRNLWIMGCYIAFIAGVFARQVTQFPTIDLNLANLRLSVFISSAIIGVALFPFAMKLILQLVRNFPGLDTAENEALNGIHILCSISWGFLIDIIISKLTVLTDVFFG